VASTTQQTGGSIAIKDEGVTIAGSASSIDFVGLGVTGTALGSDVTETISGSPGTAVTGEAVSGSGTSFTLAHVPASNTLQLFRGGGGIFTAAGDYTIVGANITLTVALEAGENLFANYSY